MGLSFLAGCAHQPSAKGPKPGDVDIAVSVDAGPPQVVGLWIVYAIAVEAEAQKLGHTDFETELAGRQLLVEGWKKARASEHLKNAYLDLLAQVSDAGLLSEYVLAYLAQPGWTLTGPQAAALDMDKWEAWRRAHLPDDHEAQTPVAIRGLRPAPVPGHGLPGREISVDRTPCAALKPALEGAVAAWDREERALHRVPISMQATSQIVPTLKLASHDDRARQERVVLVSPRVSEVVFTAGYCAVERGDFPSAERLLRQAVALSPANANIRGELAQTLIMQKRLDDADSEIDAAFDLADDACHKAMLWRKRGYILFDRGKMVDSYAAYARSLEFEPNSALAHREMQLIVKTLRSAGTYDEKALAPLVAPAKPQLHVTKCSR